MTQKSKSRNASCVPFRGRGPRSGEGVDGGKNDYDILILCLIALKGKRLTTFCASLALLHLLLSLTHWIFRSLMLPYRSSSHSAKCVRCASLRSGGRRLTVRTAMEHPIGALPRTPFPVSRDFPSKGNERYEGKKQRVIYFTYHFGVFPLCWLSPPPCPVGSMSYDTER